MRRFSKLTFHFFLFLFLASGFFLKNAYAEYRLYDAIEQFGEKRFIAPTPARIRKGPFIFHPTLKTKIEYDDNILLEDNDGKDDVIFDIRPGAIIEIPIDTHQLTVGYEADLENFTKRTDQNDQNQKAFALLDVSFPSWYINILEQFTETSGRAGTTLTSRIPRYDNTFHPKVGYKWKRFTVEGGMRHMLRDFRKQVNDNLDYELVEWTGVVFYDLFARLKALVEYNVAQIDYDDNFQRNGTYQQARVGLEGEILPNLFVKLRGGAQFRNYEESNQPDFNSWVASLLFEYDMRDNLQFELEFARAPVEGNGALVNYYVEHKIRTGVKYRPIDRWTLFTDLQYKYQGYSEQTFAVDRTSRRRDDAVRLDTGVRYRFREWLEFELAYHLSRKDSNFSTFDYTNHRVSLSSSLFY